MKKLFFGLLTLLFISCSNSQCDLESITTNTLELKIKKARLHQIDSLRSIVIETSKADQVKIKFKAKINGAKVKVRLKGDQYDHYDTDQFSLRVTQKTDSGTYAYSIQHPKTRKNINEWVFHELLKDNKVAHLGYEFVQVKLNKKDNGTYAKEEHLKNKGLLTSKGFEEGIILRFNDDHFWTDGLPAERNKAYDTKQYKKAKIKTYGSCLDSSLNKKAINLLHQFQIGKMNASDVFDLKATARLYAVCDLSGARHALRWINLVFHYNPTTGKLMPLGFDSNSNHSKGVMINEDYINTAHHKRIFDNQIFKTEYITQLKKLSDPKYLQKFLKDRECLLLKYEAMIQENQWTYGNNLNYLEGNQEIIRRYLQGL